MQALSIVWSTTFMDEKKPLSDAFKVAALPNDSPTKALGKA